MNFEQPPPQETIVAKRFTDFVYAQATDLESSVTNNRVGLWRLTNKEQLIPIDKIIFRVDNYPTLDTSHTIELLNGVERKLLVVSYNTDVGFDSFMGTADELMTYWDPDDYPKYDNFIQQLEYFKASDQLVRCL